MLPHWDHGTLWFWLNSGTRCHVNTSIPPSDPSGDANQDSASKAGLANIEHTFLKMMFWKNLLSLAGVFTGGAALYLTLIQAEAVRQQTAAAAWPYIQFSIADTDDGETARFALDFRNVGVGPAKMRAARVQLDDQPVMSWVEATQRLSDESLKLGVHYGRSSISRRVLAPGEFITAFETTHRPLVLSLQQAAYGQRVTLEYCYCSIFDECWLVNTASNDGEPNHLEVEQCPDYGASKFRD
jgi:hypothetical protein